MVDFKYVRNVVRIVHVEVHLVVGLFFACIEDEWRAGSDDFTLIDGLELECGVTLAFSGFLAEHGVSFGVFLLNVVYTEGECHDLVTVAYSRPGGEESFDLFFGSECVYFLKLHNGIVVGTDGIPGQHAGEVVAGVVEVKVVLARFTDDEVEAAG
ncbi:hypothetical protein IMSAGC014_02008 [Bacteroidaceae bacterium]|nr:hypothetical protein IMSAGC014_02008 [Bacteroidaceae bacterium]